MHPEPRKIALRSSEALALGMTSYRLRSPELARPFREVIAFGLDLAEVGDLCRAYLPVMEPGQVFSHTTALALHGIPLPPTPLVLHISVPFPRTPPRRPGVRGHSLRESPSQRVLGMPAAPAAVAWAQSAALLSREELTAVGDRLVLVDRNGRTLATPEELRLLAEHWSDRPGASRLRWAADRVRPGVRSRPETLLRLLLVRSRLPEPLVEFPVWVRPGLVLHPDLSYPEARLAIEYEGDSHRDASVWERDIERRELLAEAGWRTVRVTARQLFGDPAGVVMRIRTHLAR